MVCALLTSPLTCGQGELQSGLNSKKINKEKNRQDEKRLREWGKKKKKTPLNKQEKKGNCS